MVVPTSPPTGWGIGSSCGNRATTQELGWNYDILFAHSTDVGQTWTRAEPLNSHAGIDVGSDDERPCIAADGLGNWVVL